MHIQLRIPADVDATDKRIVGATIFWLRNAAINTQYAAEPYSFVLVGYSKCSQSLFLA